MTYEDFEVDWTAADPSSLLSQATVRSTTLPGFRRNTVDTYLYKDYGVAFWSAFAIEFEVYVDLCDTSVTVFNRVNPIGFCENELGDYVDVRDDNQMAFVVLDGESGVHLKSSQRDGAGGGTAGTPVTIALDKLYYCKFFRVGTTVTLQVFSDAARSVQVGVDSTVTCASGDAYRYALVNQSLALSIGHNVEQYVQNLSMATGGSADLYAEFEVPYSSSGDLFSTFQVRYGAGEVFAKFEAQATRNLYASFEAQVTRNLYARFMLRQSIEDLFSKFSIRAPASVDLFAEFTTNLVGVTGDLFCKFATRQIYDLSESGGIGFFWEGVGRGHVDIQILTPTGAWIGKFPDYGQKTWVALTWDLLQAVDIDGSLPDKSEITGILWTYHSAGERWLDGVYGLPKGGDPDVYGTFTLQHSTYVELKASFELS